MGDRPLAGGLVFQGTVDGRFLAMDAASGRELWSFDNHLATLAGPISYEIDREQYVAVSAGYGTSFYLVNGFALPEPGASVNSRVYAFKLGGKAPKPAIELRRVPTPRPPVIATTDEEYARAGQLYENYCLVCHGTAAITGGVRPDLRKSAFLQDSRAWRGVVVEGALATRGMPNFGAHVSPEAAELIRAYVARQAGMLYAEEAATTH